VHILFKQQKKLTLFLLGGFSLLAGLVLVLTATIGAQPTRAGDLPSPVGSTITFDKQGGTGGTSSLFVEQNTLLRNNIEGYHGGAVPINGFVAPTKVGYKFLGYFIDTTFSFQLITQNGMWNFDWSEGELRHYYDDGKNNTVFIDDDYCWSLTYNITVYAKWEQLPGHTVALPPQSGTGWVLI